MKKIILTADLGKSPTRNKAIIDSFKQGYITSAGLIVTGVHLQIDGRPIVIEFNPRPGLSQAAFRSGYGEYTERIISELWSRPNTLFC